MRLYGELSGELHVVELDRGQNCGAGSIGLCLAGNRDLATMSVFVVGYLSGSVAANDGRIRIGDELLEVSWNSEITNDTISVSPSCMLNVCWLAIDGTCFLRTARQPVVISLIDCCYQYLHQGGFSLLTLCLSVCLSVSMDNSESCRRILMKLFGGVQCMTSKN